MADDVARRVLVPRTPVPSRISNILLWVGLAWGIGVTLIADGVLATVGAPVTGRAPLRAVLLVIAWAPCLLGVFAGWLGRVPGMAWLLARTQPRLELDKEGLTIVEERGGSIRVAWQQVAEVRIHHPMLRSPVIGRDRSILATIPGALVSPRVEGSGETRLADEIARFRPDLGQALQARQRAALLVVLLVIAAAVALVIWTASR